MVASVLLEFRASILLESRPSNPLGLRVCQFFWGLGCFNSFRVFVVSILLGLRVVGASGPLGLRYKVSKVRAYNFCLRRALQVFVPYKAAPKSVQKCLCFQGLGLGSLDRIKKALVSRPKMRRKHAWS